jgi:tetratricopeptide (TPR) repeat protein
MNNAKRAPGLFVAQLPAVSSVLVPKHRFEEAEILASKIRDPFWRMVLLRYSRAERAAAARDWTRAEQEANWLADAVGTGAPGSVLFFIASVYEKQNRPLEAARHYHWAAKRLKGNHQRREAQAGLVRIQALYQDRIEVLMREAAALPGDLVPAGTLANLQMELYFLEQAEVSFRELLRAHPRHSAIPYNLGLTYMRMEEHCLAATQIRAATQAGIRGPEAWNNLGLASWRCKDFEVAASAFQEALASNSQYWHAAVNQGRMLLTQGEREKARISFLEAKRRLRLIGGSTEVVDSHLERVNSY